MTLSSVLILQQFSHPPDLAVFCAVCFVTVIIVLLYLHNRIDIYVRHIARLILDITGTLFYYKFN